MSVSKEAFEQFRAGVGMLSEMAPPATERSAEERVRIFKNTVIKSILPHEAMDLETCVHCGMCAEACHYYVTTRDPKYTPIRKLELTRRVYQREVSPNRWLRRLLTRDVTAQELEDWQELVYDSCTECGRCSLICPMGIHIAEMVALTREALANAGLAVAEQRAMSHEQGDRGTMFGMGSDSLVQAAEALKQKGIDIPLDQPQADILVVTSVIEMWLFTDALEGTARIMNKLGCSWTVSTCGYEAANFGYMAGYREYHRAAAMRVIEAAIAVGAKTVIIPECGHSYPALRWDGAAAYGKPLPFEVVAISEFVGREIKAGNLKVKKIPAAGKVTYHDPCKLGRVGGVFDEPREALQALGVDLSEVEPNRAQSYCCGGGAGNFLISRAAPLRAKVWELKRGQFEDAGADRVVTSCASCRVNFMAGAADTHWEKPIESLVALVGANLAD
ncbi:MAG: (Fe-S)-binding protein [Sedimenticolaceae bacterium]